jgi:broad specificity phosphatase PhoE
MSRHMDSNLEFCRVALIRHGETEWNRDGRWQGQCEVPLSAAGRAQAARLARRLAADGRRFDALYSSNQSRAWETASLLGGALGLAPAAAPALREINLGCWAGHTREEIAQLYPAEWERLESGEDFRRGGGETYAEFQNRILDWFAPVLRRHAGQTIAVVTHGGVVRAILLHARGLQWKDRRQIPPIGNATVSEMELREREWTIVSIGTYSGPEPEGSIAPVNEGEIV